MGTKEKELKKGKIKVKVYSSSIIGRTAHTAVHSNCSNYKLQLHAVSAVRLIVHASLVDCRVSPSSIQPASVQQRKIAHVSHTAVVWHVGIIYFEVHNCTTAARVACI